MALIYTFGIYLYRFLVFFASLFNPKAKKWIDGQKGIFEQIPSFEGQKVAWFHCASLGEFEQGRPVLESFRRQFPSYKIVLTFFSPSGYEIRKNYAHADFISYLPLDTPKNVSQFLDAIQPKLVFFVKYEFWYHYLHQLHQRGIKTYCFSAVFREKQVFFEPYGGFYRNILRNFTHIFVQNESSKNLLESIGIQQVSVAGDTRFDRVLNLAKNRKKIEEAVIFSQNKRVLIAGSVWKEDMQVLIPFINSFEGIDSFIIAPHEIRTEEIKTWQSQLIKQSICFSEINTSTKIADYQVLFIDNIGMLSSLFAYAQYAYIGGAFGKGLHNILEASTFGMPILFGTNYQKFEEAKGLIEVGGAFSVQNTAELTKKMEDLQNEQTLQKASSISRQFVEKNSGATELILKFISSEIQRQASK